MIEEKHAEEIKHLAQFLQSRFDAQKKETTGLVERVRGLERVIGDSSEHRDDGYKRTLMEAVDDVSFGVGEMLERMRDPDADKDEGEEEGNKTPEPRPSGFIYIPVLSIFLILGAVVRHEMGVSPIRVSQEPTPAPVIAPLARPSGTLSFLSKITSGTALSFCLTFVLTILYSC